jgi:hypothetical protein
MKIISTVKDFIDDIKSESSDIKFALGIATTSFEFDEPFFSFPREIKDWGYYFHIVCPSSDSGIKVVNALADHIDVFFLDSENKKTEFCNIEIRKRIPNTEFESIYPNDVTILSCFDLIDSINEGDIFIFGHGNLAFRFATLLNQRNMNFLWTPSRATTSEKYLSMKKEFHLVETDSLNSEIKMLFNFSPQSSDFFNTLADYPKIKIVDVSSKGAFGNCFKDRVNALDISARLVNEIKFILMGNIYNSSYGRTTDSLGVSYISGGYPGNFGDLVVDNYASPSYLIGISDGVGGFSKRINKALKDN